MKFLADMGISPKTVSYLNDSGQDAVHLHELGLDRLQDSDILEKARLESYVLLTHDLDFDFSCFFLYLIEVGLKYQYCSD